MECTYRLKIYSNDGKIKEITSILDVFPTSECENYWTYELIRSEDDEYIDFIEVFTKILDNRLSMLEKIGILREDITFLVLYEYDKQCNMEFSSVELNKIANSGATLCISCWKKGDTIEFDE